MRGEHIDEPFREFPIRSFLRASRETPDQTNQLFENGKRINMPWRGSFEPHAWGVASLMDFAVPVVACLLVWLLVNRENHYARGIPQDVQVLHKKAHH